MKNLIIIEGKNKIQLDNLEELIRKLICENFFELKKEEKKEILKKKSILNTMLFKIECIELNENKNNYQKDKFIIFDEITYILSLLKFNRLFILEKTCANIFGKYIEKSNITDNYIILNTFANEILEKYIKQI